MMLYSVTVEFETTREAQMCITSLYLARSEREARRAALAYAAENYDISSWEPARITGCRPYAGEFAPVRFGELTEQGWREVETRRPLEPVA